MDIVKEENLESMEVIYEDELNRPSTSGLQYNLNDNDSSVDEDDDDDNEDFDGKRIFQTLLNMKTENEEEIVSQLLNEEAIDINTNLDDSSTTQNASSDEEEEETTEVPESKKIRRGPRKLPTALKGLMGEANLRFARGDRETAEKICFQIIKEVPKAPEPYTTMASIYEEEGDREKALQMQLLAAHLSNTNVYEWTHLADVCEELGKDKEATICYLKAINLDLGNVELHLKRINLIKKISNKKNINKAYYKMIYNLSPDESEHVMPIAKQLVETLVADQDTRQATNICEYVVRKYQSSLKVDFMNLYLDILIKTNEFEQCLKLMVEFCDLVIEAQTNTESSFEIIDCTLSPSTPIEILSKLASVLIHLKSFHLIDKVTSPLKYLNTNEVGEYFLEIALAYIEEKRFEDAIPFFELLTNSDMFNTSEICAKYGDCLKEVGRLSEAANTYRDLLYRVQENSEIKMKLSAVLKELGHHDDAISVLSQCSDEALDIAVLYEKCLLLKNDESREKELIILSQILFFRHCMKLRNKEEINVLSLTQRFDRKKGALRALRRIRNEIENDVGLPVFKCTGPNPPVEEEWKLFKYVCTLCVKHKFYKLFHYMAFTAHTSNVFTKFKLEINLLSVFASYFIQNTYTGYNIVRALVTKYNLNMKLWGLFNLIIMPADDSRHNRFLMRLLSKNPEHNKALGILYGNNCLMSGTYKYSLHEYSTFYKHSPSPLCTFLMGLTFLQMAAQKFTNKKHNLVTQSVAFLSEYKNKRGLEGLQEAHYNLGRAFQHLGLYNTAVFHYKEVFKCDPPNFPMVDDDVFDLKKEAAFNLHLIYLSSGSRDLATMYINKYIVI